MPLLDMNMNMNMNMAFAPSGAGGRWLHPRFNSDLYAQLVNTTLPNFVVPAPPYPRFSPDWDADLKSYKYLNDFVCQFPNWFPGYRTEALAHGIPAQNMNQNQLNGEALIMMQLALEREDRFAEIIDQDNAEGAINYYLGMLGIDPARHPKTYLMMCVGRRIGEHIVMCLKDDFGSPRPSQLCPAITPMIDPPATPSFPAGHAVQAYLIAYLLAYTLPRLPQHSTPSAPAYPGTQGSGLLFDLAERISQNRIVAGIHYQTDINAGIAVAIKCFNDLQNVPSIWGTTATTPAVTGLRQDVQGELTQYA